MYSLALYGRQRFVAGGARHCLIKIFDFRMAGGRAYDYRDENPCICSSGQYGSIQQALEIGGKSCTHFQSGKKSAANYNVFCAETPPNLQTGSHHIPESPVYALSSPSPISSNLFIGLEGEVCEHNAVSIAQETLHPSPIYSTSPLLGPSREILSSSPKSHGSNPLQHRQKYLKSAWDPDNRVKNLSCYSQVEMGELKLMKQVDPGSLFREEPTCAYDERFWPTNGFDADVRRVFH